MSSQTKPDTSRPLDLSRWRSLPTKLIVVGGLLALIGFAVSWKHDGLREFASSWLVAYMFFLSVCLGAFFLVLVHHLFDAGWSVPIRRFCEHIASLLFPWMAILFLPIVFQAKKLKGLQSQRVTWEECHGDRFAGGNTSRTCNSNSDRLRLNPHRSLKWDKNEKFAEHTRW